MSQVTGEEKGRQRVGRLGAFALLTIGMVLLLPVQVNADPPDEVRYDGHKMIVVTMETDDDVETMLNSGAMMMPDTIGIGTFEFVASPDALAVIDSAGIEYSVTDENIQASIDAERERIASTPPVNPRAPIFKQDSDMVPYSDPPVVSWYEEFKTYDETMARIQAWEEDHPDLVEVVTVATTLENRAVKAVRISKGSGDKQALYIQGGQHAREWISPMVAMYVGDILIWGWDNNQTIHDLLVEFEVILIPVTNPDGKVYCHDHDRMWRKNRHPFDIGGTTYYGVDLNRNWDVDWGVTGVNHDVTYDPSYTYCGEGAFSENETTGISNFILSNPNINTTVDLHSYANLLLWPWAYTTTPLPADEEEAYSTMAHKMGDRIFGVHGEIYGYELYGCSGTAKDWGHLEGMTSFSFELRPYNPTYNDPLGIASTQGGFMLDPDFIIPNGEEIFRTSCIRSG